MTFFFNVSSSLLFLELLSECSDMSERTQRHIATLRKELTQTWPPTTSCISCHCLSNPPTSHSQYNSPIHFWSLILFKLTLLRVAWSKTAAKTTSSFSLHTHKPTILYCLASSYVYLCWFPKCFVLQIVNTSPRHFSCSILNWTSWLFSVNIFEPKL